MHDSLDLLLMAFIASEAEDISPVSSGKTHSTARNNSSRQRSSEMKFRNHHTKDCFSGEINLAIDATPFKVHTNTITRTLARERKLNLENSPSEFSKTSHEHVKLCYSQINAVVRPFLSILGTCNPSNFY